MGENFFYKTKQAVLESFNVEQKNGLAESSLISLRAKYGSNALKEKAAKTVLAIIFDQLKEVMVLILIAAAAISFFLHEAIDAFVILIIVVLNTVLGFWQEFNAARAMSALKKMAQPNARVRRDQVEKTIPAKEILPGDIIVMEAGNLIPADARIIACANLKVQEAALTGESEPVEKTDKVMDKADIALADRKNMVYMGTIVTYGRAEAVVTGIGMKTELGKIASMLQDVEDEKTPLQKRLAKLGIKLAYFALILIGVVAVICYFRGLGVKEIFMTAISLAVAAIPEGLPAVVTISLALGARRMFKRKALIRNLPAVETLGSVTVICSDKTGTLTKNEMTVTDILMTDKKLNIDEIAQDPNLYPAARLCLLCAALCNDAVITKSEKNEKTAIGDPTEGALVIAAEKGAIVKNDAERFIQRLAEYPFDSDRKRMSTLHAVKSISDGLKGVFDLAYKNSEAGNLIFTKGSVDGLIEVCSKVIVNDQIVDLTDALKQEILEENKQKASKGIRVLGMAYRIIPDLKQVDINSEEKELIFIGMVCMIDPVRPEAIEAVKTCKNAGVRVVMITGDHPLTARAIGQKLGLAENGKFLTGKELSQMSAEQIQECIKDVSIFARVSPEHKMIIIDALQADNEIVSMTGDGVNDAPALKSADIGVAMGITGTDVSKEAADMVLLDDNFATIVEAVKEGRTIFDNIRKFIKYILTGNMGEIMVMIIGPFFGMPLPLLPIQILWINLVTDGAPAVALGYEQAESDIMNRPPFSPNEGVFSRGIGKQILFMGTIIGVVSIAIGYFFWKLDPSSRIWQTMVFSTIAFCQISLVMSIRKTKDHIFTKEFFSNLPMLAAVGLTFILQLAIIYNPFLNKVFKTQPLSLKQFCVCLAAGLFIMIFAELQKLIFRKNTKRI
ncbi:MAG: cation-translocating P-type ATPase [Candidatus Omnitrophica bacterium]|nr:cation-translocating P-type ATPase [Candidatus Omnitrophota bacterium]